MATRTLPQTAPPRPHATTGEVLSAPRLAPGIELIGLYEGSGYKDPPYLVRRGDGQMVQLTGLLYLVAEHCDGATSSAGIAEDVSAKFGKTVSEDNVRFLITEKLRPLGVVVGDDGTTPEVKKADPLLALKFRTKVVPAWIVRAITAVFLPLFWSPLLVLILGAFVALDVWVFGIHGVAQSVRATMYQPGFIVLIFGLAVVSAAFHEIGHATACRKGGAKPGAMGVGIYIVYPAFYTDVTDAYRLGKGGRLRVDLGGVYFNVIFSLATAAAYFYTGFEPLILVIVVQHLEMLHQFLPFLRLDGYYVIADLTGVPDLFGRIKPTLLSMLPWVHRRDKRVEELKPWVRFAVTGWILLVIPIILHIYATMIINAPRMFGTAADAFSQQWDKLTAAFGDGRTMSGASTGIQLLFLVLPLFGITFILVRTAKRITMGGWHWSDGRPLRRTAVVLTLGGVAAFLAFTWWPNGDYVPIQRGERWTIPDTIAAATQVATGRPSIAYTARGFSSYKPAGHDKDLAGRSPSARGTGVSSSGSEGSSTQSGAGGSGGSTGSSASYSNGATTTSAGGAAATTASPSPSPTGSDSPSPQSTYSPASSSSPSPADSPSSQG